MDLTQEERERLADVVRLQPTTNGELGDRWGMESGSEVHRYLEDHLGEYYYRDDDSYIRATADAAGLVDAAPGVVDGDDGDGPRVVRVPELEAQVFDVLAGPGERSQSVVSTLHDLRDERGVDPPVDEVRSALRALKRKGVVELEHRTVPTFRRAADADDVRVEGREDPADGEASTAEASDGDAGDRTPEATADSRFDEVESDPAR